MRKIVPFKKELLFKTKLSEITSISLEHTISKKDKDLISGNFIINGEYKMTEGSINREKYNFDLPFDIALNPVYNLDTMKIDIDNFYYEIIDNEILKVNIDLLIEADEIVEPIRETKEVKEEILTEEIEPEFLKINTIDSLENDIDVNINNANINNNDNLNINLFDNIENVETFSTYYVYIVKEDDTIEKILDKYNIAKEDLELYNNIENIKPFDKIIIPANGQ